jgi:hypothetical protein
MILLGLTPGRRLSETISRFSSIDRRRRRDQLDPLGRD